MTDTLQIAREALDWYRENTRLARLIHREGDAGRHALADDGGKIAAKALAAIAAAEDDTTAAEIRTWNAASEGQSFHAFNHSLEIKAPSVSPDMIGKRFRVLLVEEPK